MKIIKNIISSLKWRHWVLIALLILIAIVKTNPLCGFIYTTRIYPFIGAILSRYPGHFPFAVGDVFIFLSITWGILYPFYEIGLRKRLARRFIVLVPKGNCYPKKRIIFRRVFEYLLWVYAWFYIAWGLNYSQPNIYCRIGMKPVEVSKVKFRAFAYKYADSLNYYSEGLLNEERRVKSEETKFGDRRESQSNSCNDIDDQIKKKTAKEILQGYKLLVANEKDSKNEQTMKSRETLGINAPFNPNPHAKTMVFSRLSSMAGVTGSMAPFFCEFTLNCDIRPHDYPATYSHEFAHFLGVANEGEANFYSYIVCTASADRYVKFSGYYHIFFHVLSNVFDILGEKEGEKYLKHIRPEIIQLARSDRKYWLDKRCKTLDDAQDFIFDLYLRGNHVAEGRKSYSGVIALILAWEEKKNN